MTDYRIIQCGNLSTKHVPEPFCSGRKNKEPIKIYKTVFCTIQNLLFGNGNIVSHKVVSDNKRIAVSPLAAGVSLKIIIPFCPVETRSLELFRRIRQKFPRQNHLPVIEHFTFRCFIVNPQFDKRYGIFGVISYNIQFISIRQPFFKTHNINCMRKFRFRSTPVVIPSNIRSKHICSRKKQ